MFFPTLILAGLVAMATARQASNFYVPREVAARYGCEGTCYENFLRGIAADLELLGVDFDFAFYNTASNFSTSKPGDLLKLEPIEPSTLKDTVVYGASYYRFQYTSLTIDGTKVPATGFIAIPFAPYPGSNSYRTIAFVHGTTGLWHGCAPSNSPVLSDSKTWRILAAHGYAIVATDYSGLGSNYTEHKYLTFPEQANDVFYSMMAARQAFGEALSQEWMSIGHSQGGGTVWKLAESSLLRSDQAQQAGKYLGTVAIAPGTKIYDMAVLGAKILFDDPEKLHLWEISGELIWLGILVKRLIPSYNMSIYGAELRKRVDLMKLSQACSMSAAALTLDLDAHQLLGATNLSEELNIQLFQNLTAPGRGGRSEHPILVLQGLNDTAVLADTTRSAYEDSCKFGNEVQLKFYEDLDHSAIIPASAPMWLDWIDSRFRHAVTNSSRECTTQTFKAWDPVHMKATSEINVM